VSDSTSESEVMGIEAEEMNFEQEMADLVAVEYFPYEESEV
jgi:hypothetical protein